MKRNNTRRNSVVCKILFICITILFTLYAITLLYPFYFAFNASLMDGARTFMKNRIAFPNPVKFDNYIKAITQLKVGKTGFLMMTFNSVWYSLGNAVFGMATTMMTTYVVCKYKFRGREFIYSLVLILDMIPIYGTLPATYRLYDKLGMLESPLILLSAFSGRAYFLYIYAFWRAIPMDYAEAAFIDGASDRKVFWHIMVPMILPSVSAIFIMQFTGLWNSYDGPMLYLSRNYPTLSVGLFMYEKRMQYKANHPVYFAGVIWALIPILLLFGFFQNTIMSKVHLGGLKQ